MVTNKNGFRNNKTGMIKRLTKYTISYETAYDRKLNQHRSICLEHFLYKDIKDFVAEYRHGSKSVDGRERALAQIEFFLDHYDELLIIQKERSYGNLEWFK